MTQCRLANVGVVAALGRLVCPVRRVHRGGRNVETPRYVELPHVLRVSYFHVLQSFHVVEGRFEQVGQVGLAVMSVLRCAPRIVRRMPGWDWKHFALVG